MGQKCSCLCNKENDNTFNFYPESSFNQDLKEGGVKSLNANNNVSNENFAKLMQSNKEFTKNEREVEMSKEEEAELFIKANIHHLVKIQHFCRIFLNKRRFKSQYKQLKDNQLKEKKKIIENLTTISTKSAMEMVKEFPFNPLKCISEEYLNQLSDNQKIDLFKIMKNFINLENFKIKENQMKKSTLQPIDKGVYQDALLENGSLYSGFLNLNKQKHGYGKFLKNTGEVYEGYWLRNDFTGYGRYISEEGNVLEGKFNIILFIFTIFYFRLIH